MQTIAWRFDRKKTAHQQVSARLEKAFVFYKMQTIAYSGYLQGSCFFSSKYELSNDKKIFFLRCKRLHFFYREKYYRALNAIACILKTVRKS